MESYEAKVTKLEKETKNNRNSSDNSANAQTIADLERKTQLLEEQCQKLKSRKESFSNRDLKEEEMTRELQFKDNVISNLQKDIGELKALKENSKHFNPMSESETDQLAILLIENENLKRKLKTIEIEGKSFNDLERLENALERKSGEAKDLRDKMKQLVDENV